MRKIETPTEEDMKMRFEIYKKLYSNPFYWFIRPHDGYIDGNFLRRCDCGKLVMSKGAAVSREHLGHMKRPVRETSAWEYIKLRLGMVK